MLQVLRNEYKIHQMSICQTQEEKPLDQQNRSVQVIGFG